LKNASKHQTIRTHPPKNTGIRNEASIDIDTDKAHEKIETMGMGYSAFVLSGQAKEPGFYAGVEGITFRRPWEEISIVSEDTITRLRCRIP
jgi:hypothetical protein